MDRFFVGMAGLAGLGAVAMSAVAAHALPQRLDAAALAMVHSAIEMQAWHALALLGTGAWLPRGGVLARLAGWAFVLGLVAFCGAVYALGLAGVRTGLLAPTGGITLMLGWALLGASALRARA